MFCVIPFLLLGSNALALQTAEKKYYDLTYAENHFSGFVQKYGKTYKSEDEYKNRLEIFRRNLEKINNLNKINEESYDVNKFTDLTEEEFARTHFGLIPNIATNVSELITVEDEWIANAPDSLDYRTQNLVTHVKDQGDCGSCYMFSVIGNIEGQYAKKHGDLVALSEQQGLDCGSQGCRGGMLIPAMMELAAQGGCEPEFVYPPYQHERLQCRFDASKVRVKVLGGIALHTSTEEKLKGALAHYGPLSVALYMPHESSGYTSGIYSSPLCNIEPVTVNHGVVLVGYGTEPCGKDYWIIKNSWGADWGEQGYLRLERGTRRCHIGEVGPTSTAIVE